MGQIQIETCEIEGLRVITPQVFGDARGYFMETYQKEQFVAAGIDMEFVQDNQSSSTRGVLRGLHFQKHHPQDKIVRVVSGKVFDVAVDLRTESTLAYVFQMKIRSSSTFRRISHMVFWCFRIRRNLPINVPIFIIRMTREDWHTTIRRSGLTGLWKRVWH